MIRKGITSKEHDDCVLFLCNKFKLKAIEIRGNASISGQYFPDAVNHNTDYEVEVVPRTFYLKLKVAKWNKKRKKILILKPNSFALNNFDNIFVYSKKNTLIKIK